MVDDIKDQPLSLTFRHFPNEEFVAFFLLFSANLSPKLSSMPFLVSWALGHAVPSACSALPCPLGLVGLRSSLKSPFSTSLGKNHHLQSCLPPSSYLNTGTGICQHQRK